MKARYLPHAVRAQPRLGVPWTDQERMREGSSLMGDRSDTESNMATIFKFVSGFGSKDGGVVVNPSPRDRPKMEIKQGVDSWGDGGSKWHE